ncbi:MAG: type II toxin-antitoxin system RelE/ParE family toxin [Actinomycetota bacterium]|nr:type II toxin-antitoxin system RelE/ParE family toxin [Actinomycetota bacterium]
MIKSFKHKGLKLFHEAGRNKGINPEHAPKLARILDRLDASKSPADMDLPGYKLHMLTGKKQGQWAVSGLSLKGAQND